MLFNKTFKSIFMTMILITVFCALSAQKSPWYNEQLESKPFLLVNIGTGAGINLVHYNTCEDNRMTANNDFGLNINFPIKDHPMAVGIDLRYTAFQTKYQCSFDDYNIFFVGGNFILKPPVGFFTLTPGVAFGEIKTSGFGTTEIKPNLSMRMTSGIDIKNNKKTAGQTGVFVNQFRGKVNDATLTSITVGLFLDVSFNLHKK